MQLERFQSTLSLCDSPACWNTINTIHPEDFASFGVLMVVGSAMYDVNSKSPTGFIRFRFNVCRGEPVDKLTHDLYLGDLKHCLSFDPEFS